MTHTHSGFDLIKQIALAIVKLNRDVYRVTLCKPIKKFGGIQYDESTDKIIQTNLHTAISHLKVLKSIN